MPQVPAEFTQWIGKPLLTAEQQVEPGVAHPSLFPTLTRFIAPNQPTTRDYRKDRLNVYFDQERIIQEMNYG